MNSEQKTVIFDLDDTLANLRLPMQEALNKYTNKDIKWTDWKSFDITGLYEVNDEEFYNVLVDSDILNAIEPYEETPRTLKAVRDAGHKIVIITSRKYHPDALNVTQNWFEKHNLPFDNIHISGHGIRKSIYTKLYDNIIMAVDDNADNCNDFIKNGNINNTMLMDMPWNSVSDIKRIYTIDQVLDQI
jgi:uncharacterized HAD superfamily protein